MCRSCEPAAGLDDNTEEAGHCAEQGHGQGNSGRGDVEQAKGVGERGMASSTRAWDGGADNRQCSWMLGCPSGMQRRSNLSSVTNAGKRRVKETVRGSQNNSPFSCDMSHVQGGFAMAQKCCGHVAMLQKCCAILNPCRGHVALSNP